MSSITTGRNPGKKDEEPKTIGNYVMGQEIGKGSFATVYKGSNRETHEAVAIKSVVRSKLKSKKLIENLEIEISILKTMKHPHIVDLLDYRQTASHFHLVMDYCSMGDLSYFIRKRGVLAKTHPVISSLLERYPSPEGSHGLHETLVVHFLKQLASALEFLRSKSLVHRDIKPQNLLLCPPVHSKKDFEECHFVGLWELPVLKIADFGFARFLPSTSMAETLCGSPLYMAPEILRYEKYNAKADLWSVGAVLYEMTVGKPPFRADNHVQLLKNIEKANDRIKFPSSAQVPESLKSLIRSLLKYNPTERVSFNEFFKDPLIVNELESNDRPLERSEMDENLFISEYIFPTEKFVKYPQINPLTDRASGSHEGKRDSDLKKEGGEIGLKEESEVGKGNPSVESNDTSFVEGEATSRGLRSSKRDEDIKTIITKNSPVSDSNLLCPEFKVQDNAVAMKKEQDLVLERDYVMVEKRAVEVNAIADELAHAGSGALAIKPRLLSDAEETTAANQNSIVQSYRRPSTGRNSASGQRKPSFTERRISISISPTNALTKALGLASSRLFGVLNNNAVSFNTSRGATQGNEGKTGQDDTYDSISNTFSTVISGPNFANNLLLKKLNLPISATIANLDAKKAYTSVPQSSDEVVLSKLESIATKAHAIKLFADVKFSQLIPSPPSSDGLDDDLVHHNDLLPPKIVETISQEGVVLYVKTLSLLAEGMAIASDWWYSDFERKDLSGDSWGDDATTRPSAESIHTSFKINELVQWIREKFNECLEKAEFIRLRLQEALRSISEDNSNFNDDDETNTKSAPVAEKLIFDRALEISRNAAVNELVQEDLKGCELAYSTAIWMLEALLDEDPALQGEHLDLEDKAMVEKFIISIGNRLSVLKKKLELF